MTSGKRIGLKLTDLIVPDRDEIAPSDDDAWNSSTSSKKHKSINFGTSPRAGSTPRSASVIIPSSNLLAYPGGSTPRGSGPGIALASPRAGSVSRTNSANKIPAFKDDSIPQERNTILTSESPRPVSSKQAGILKSPRNSSSPRSNVRASLAPSPGNYTGVVKRVSIDTSSQDGEPPSQTHNQFPDRPTLVYGTNHTSSFDSSRGRSGSAISDIMPVRREEDDHYFQLAEKARGSVYEDAMDRYIQSKAQLDQHEKELRDLGDLDEFSNLDSLNPSKKNNIDIYPSNHQPHLYRVESIESQKSQTNVAAGQFVPTTPTGELSPKSRSRSFHRRYRKVVDLQELTSAVYKKDSKRSQRRTFGDILQRVSELSQPLDKHIWKGPVTDDGLWHGSAHMATFDNLKKFSGVEMKANGDRLGDSSQRGDSMRPSRDNSPHRWRASSPIERRSTGKKSQVYESEFKEWLKTTQDWRSKVDKRIQAQRNEIRGQEKANLIPKINHKSHRLSAEATKKEVIRSALELLSLEKKSDIHTAKTPSKAWKSSISTLSPSRRRLNDASMSVMNTNVVVNAMIGSIFDDSVDHAIRSAPTSDDPLALAHESSRETKENNNNENKRNYFEDSESDTGEEGMRQALLRRQRSMDDHSQMNRSPSVHDVFDRLILGGMVAAKKNRSWTPEPDKELTLKPQVNELSNVLAERRKLSKSTIELSSLDAKDVNQATAGTALSSSYYLPTFTTSIPKHVIASPLRAWSPSSGADTKTRMQRKPPLDQGTEEFRQSIKQSIQRTKSRRSGHRAADTSDDESVASRASRGSSARSFGSRRRQGSVGSESDRKEYIEEGYSITRKRAMSAQQKRLDRVYGKELAINRQIERHQTESHESNGSNRSQIESHLFPRQNTPIKQTITKNEAKALQDRMNKSVETFLIRQTIARNLSPPGPGSYAYAHLDFLSLQPSRGNAGDNQSADRIYSVNSSAVRARSPGSYGHRFSSLDRFNDPAVYPSPGKYIPPVFNLSNHDRNMISSFSASSSQMDGFISPGNYMQPSIGSTATNMASIYKAARTLIASASPNKQTSHLDGDTVAERRRSRAQKRKQDIVLTLPQRNARQEEDMASMDSINTPLPREGSQEMKNEDEPGTSSYLDDSQGQSDSEEEERQREDARRLKTQSKQMNRLNPLQQSIQSLTSNIGQ